MEPHTAPDLLPLEHLQPRPDGLARLLEKRVQRARALRASDLIPVAACAASILLMFSMLRSPRIDIEQVRREFVTQGTTLQLMGEGAAVVEQRAVIAGVHIYAVRRDAAL